ncbi:aldo/keto reductase [Alcaligenaceae bacterium C4P045]|nr:aldo/keto reductase [Alcaligenaceae bacterium C4P045]
MQRRALGRSGLTVPPLTFGGNVFGWTVSEVDAFSLLDALVDAGLNFIDTADVYSRWVPGNRGGESEVIIGRWLEKTGKRDQVIIGTKVGMDMGPGAKGLAPAYINRAIDDSLARLHTDYIDLYQSHEDDATTPLADTLGAYAKLIEQGKVRAIGASNYTSIRLSEALIESERHGLPRYESIQPEYNVYSREPYESGIQAVATAQDIGVIPYFALAAGFLTGKYRSAADANKSLRGKNIIDKYLNPRGERILAALDQVAESSGATLGQVALAWQLAQPGITSPIASATSLEQLNELVAAAHLKLSPEDIDVITQASAWQKEHV